MDNYQIRKELYDADSLYLGFNPSDERSYATCYDAHVYNDYIASGKHSRDLAVTLPRTSRMQLPTSLSLRTFTPVLI